MWSLCDVYICVGSWSSAADLYAYNGFNVSVVEEALRICLFVFFSPLIVSREGKFGLN